MTRLFSFTMLAATLSLSLLSVTAAHAQTPPAASPPPPDVISAERPGFTNGTDTVKPGRFQFETGYLFAHQGGSDSRHLDDSGQFRLPTGENTEVRLVLPVYYLKGTGMDTSNGIGDFGVSYKWRFLEEAAGRHPSLALIAGTSIPSGAHEVWANRLQPTADLEAQYALSPSFQLQANLNYTRGDDGGTEFNQYGGAINLSYNLTPVLNPFVEFARQTPTGADGSPSATYFDGGVTYVLGRNVQLDLNAGTELATPLRSDHFYGVGFARRW